MTGIARLRGRNVRSRFCLSVDCRVSTAVASGAVTGSSRAGGARVTHDRRSKGNKTVVTRITSRCRRDVISRFAYGGRSIVTT